MSIARDLAAFLTRASYADIPPHALDHAAVLISSTVASAACGSGIASSSIIRALAKERGGTPDASIWFDSGIKLPVADAAQVNAVMSGVGYNLRFILKLLRKILCLVIAAIVAATTPVPALRLGS